MAILAEFTAPPETFPLGGLFEEIPEASMELDRIVPTYNAIIPYVWVSDGSEADIEAAVRKREITASLRKVDAVEDFVLYRVDWDETKANILSCIVETEVSLLSGTGTREKWEFEIRADSQDGISAFQQCCQANGISLTLRRIHTLAKQQSSDRYNLTPAQREALTLAFMEGYYEEPSETNLEELAARLDISRPSLSARLKRGYRNLIGSTVIQRRGVRENKRPP